MTGIATRSVILEFTVALFLSGYIRNRRVLLCCTILGRDVLTFVVPQF
jgi:hypothetical protein